MGFYWSTIHASFILKKADKNPAAKGLLWPEKSRVQEFYWRTGIRQGCLTDRKHLTHRSQSFVSQIGYIHVPEACNHRLSLLFHLPLFIIIHFAVRVSDICPMFLKTQVCVQYGIRTSVHQSGHQSSYWLWTSVLNFSDQWELVSHTIHPKPQITNA